MEVKIKYIVKGLEPIKAITNGDWIDLRSAEDIEMKAGEFRLIPLGVAMKLPEGFEAIVAPRSSTFKKYKIMMVNSIGIIDESYCGNDDQWQFPALAFADCHIHKNDRICQFRIIRHQPKLHFVKVEKMDDPNRNGFGSTGSV